MHLKTLKKDPLGGLSYDTQTINNNTVVSSNVEVSQNVNSDRNIQYYNFSEARVKASQNSNEKDRNSMHLAQEGHIPDNIGDETSNDALELSTNLDQHSNYLAAHVCSHEIVPPTSTEVTKGMDSSSTRFKTADVTMQTSNEVGTTLKTLVNIVKYNSMAQQNNDDLPQSSGIGDKENNLISTGKNPFHLKKDQCIMYTIYCKVEFSRCNNKQGPTIGQGWANLGIVTPNC